MSESNGKKSADDATKRNKDLVCDDDDADEEIFDRSLSKEAQRVVNEIGFGVDTANVSEVLESSESLAYVNIRTLEKEDFCVELSASGYMIVSRGSFDRVDEKLRDENLKSDNGRYETCEALMHQISPAFVKKFNMSVAERLNHI